MEEKQLIKSDNTNHSTLMILAIICLVIAVIAFIGYSIQYSKASELISTYWDGYEANEYLYKYGNSDSAINPFDYKKEYSEVRDYAYAEMGKAKTILPIALVSTLIFIVSAFRYMYIGKTNMTVTNRRVYGNAVFGKRVDLPLSSISIIEIGKSKKITLATSAGKVRFAGIKNRDEIYNTIQTLLANK